MGAVPQTVDDHVLPWLTDVLGAHGTLAAAQVARIGAGSGFVGELGRVSLRWEQAASTAPSSVIVKLPTADPGGRMVGQMMGLYERESRFYRELAHKVPVRVPTCYVNVAEPETDTWALVLEDLAPLEPGDQVAGASLAQARLVIQRLARLHARFYDSPELDELTWIPRLAGPMTDALVPMFDASWDAFVEHYGPRTPPRVLTWMERFAPTISSFVDRYVDLPCTICHGDFRLDNMFFGGPAGAPTGGQSGGQSGAQSGGQVSGEAAFALIDWQMAMCVPGSSDLVYFLVTNMPAELRREHQWELIDLYLDTLRAEGVGEDLLARDTVLQGYREGALLYGVMFVSTMTMERANARGEAFFDELVGRTMAAIDDLESGDALRL